MSDSRSRFDHIGGQTAESPRTMRSLATDACRQTSLHARTRRCMRAGTIACVHFEMRACMPECMQSSRLCTPAQRDAWTHAVLHACIPACMRENSCASTHEPVRAGTSDCMHARRDACTHEPVHADIPDCMRAAARASKHERAARMHDAMPACFRPQPASKNRCSNVVLFSF